MECGASTTGLIMVKKIRRNNDDEVNIFIIVALLWTVFTIWPTVTSGQKLWPAGNGREKLHYDTIDGNHPLFIERQKSFTTNNNAANSILVNQSRPGKTGQRALALITNLVTTNTTCGYNNGAVGVLAGTGLAPYQYAIDQGPWVNSGNFPRLYAGNHMVHVRDAAGISDSAAVILTNTYTPLNSPYSDFDFNINGCSAKTGTFTIRPSGGTLPYTYSYDLINFQSSPTFTDLYPGIYQGCVKDANGCVSVTHENILPGGCSLSYSLAAAGYSCVDDGRISFEVISGTPPYLYSLDSVHYQTTGEFSGLGPGMHVVYIKDANNVHAVYAVPEYKNCEMASFVTVTNAGCGKANGTVNISTTNGAPPYSYSVDGVNFLSTTLFTNLAPGYYPITTKDANQQICFVTAQVKSDCPVVTAFANPAACGANTGSITASARGGVSPYSYSINGVLFQTGNQFNNLAAGAYTVTVKDANGYKDSTVVTVLTSSCFTDSASVTDATCSKNNGSITVYANGGTPPYLYSIDGVTYQSNNTFTNLGAAIYTTYVKDVTNALAYIPVTVKDHRAPVLSFINTPAGCNANDGSLIINTAGGTAPFKYSLDGINFSLANQFANVTAGSYLVTVQDSNNCLVQQAVVMAVSCTTIGVTQIDEACGLSNGSISVTASGGTAPYQYSINGGSYQSSALFINLAHGNYIISVKDAANKITTKNAALLNNCFIVTAAVTNATCGNHNGAITVSGNGGNTPYQYSIDGINFKGNTIFTGLDTNLYTIVVKDALNNLATTTVRINNIAGPGIKIASTTASCTNTNGKIIITGIGGTMPYQFSIDNSNYQSSNTFNSLAAGKFNGWIRDANGCKAIDAITVLRLAVPNVYLGNDTALCVGDSMLLRVPLTPQYTYLWKDGSTSNKYVVHTAGVYFLKVTNQFNCSFTDTLNILPKQLPAFTLGNDTSICTGKNLQLQVSLPNAIYQWSNGSNASGIIISRAGLYWVNISQEGCYKKDSIFLSEKPVPVVSLGSDTTLCEGKTVLINAGNTSNNYLWQDNSNANTYLVTKEGQYIVFVNKNNCVVSDTINVYYTPKPIFTLGPAQFICQGQTVILQPNINPQWQLQWQDASTKSFYNVMQPGQYYIDATNTCGTTREEVLFTKGLCQVYVPNAFSPNGDTKNDIFKVSGTELIAEFHLRIFNRYGQLIFETTDKNKGWDGSIKNQPVETGNYVYLLEYKESASAKKQMVRGSCLLIR